MTDVLRFSKKAFTWSVVALTILWSVGASALISSVPANAASCVLEAGDLFKVAGSSAVYYVNGAGQRVPFFHANHFKTLYQDYSAVVTCDASATSQYPLSGVVPTTLNLRAGELYKVTSEPAVYAVMARASGDTDPRSPVCQIASEAAATALGYNLKTDVLDLPDYLVGNYRKTGMCADGLINGMLVSKPGNNQVYFVNDGQLWMVDGSLPQFLAKKVRSLNTGLAVGSGSITPAAIVEKSLPIGGGSSTPVTAGALTVSLASDTPAAANVVTDGTYGAQAMIPVLKVNMVASSAGPVTVTSLKFKRGGISADTEINNAHLYMGDMWVASNPSISNGVLTFSNASGLFTVAAGSSQALTLKIDLKNASSGGKSLTFALSDVGVSAGSVAGLPLAAGNTFTTVAVTDLGKLALTSISPSSAGTVDPGLTNYEVWRLQAVATNQDMELRKLTLTVVGSVSVGDLKNFSLWSGATQIGTTVPEMSSARTVTFDLSAAPYVITKGQTKILSVKTDIAGGTNRTFRVSLQNDRDLLTYDKQYNVFVKANGTDSFAIVEPNNGATPAVAVNFTVNTGTLTQSLSASSPTGNIADGATNVELARFNWAANGEAVKVSSLSVSSTASTQTRTLTNVRLLVDGSQVGTTISSLTASGAANTGFGTFGNSFIIPAGKSVEVKVVADLTGTDVAAGDTFVVGLAAGSSNAQGTVSLTSISTVAQNASTLTVKAGTVSVAKNSAFGNRSSANPTGPLNATQVKVASFTIVGGAGEDVEVSQISLKDDSASCIGSYMQNLTLKSAAGAQLGVTYANPSTSCSPANTYTFNISPAVVVPKGSQYVVDVFADLKATYTGAASLIELDSVMASGKDTGTSANVTSANVSLQNVYISAVGTLTVAVNSATRLATNLVFGSVDQDLATFDFTADNSEDLNLSEIVVSVNVSSTATGTLRNIKLVDETGAQVGSTIASLDSSEHFGGTSYANAKFSGLNLKVAKGQNKAITVKSDITPFEVTGLTETGYAVQVAMLSTDTDTATAGTQYSVTGNGASSGAALSISAGSYTANAGNVALSDISRGTSTQLTANAGHARGNEFVIYKTKLSVAWHAETPSGSSSGSGNQIVGVFAVTNAANAGNYAATVRYMNFDISTTISNTTSRALKVYKDNLTTTPLFTSNYVYTVNPVTFGDTTISDASFEDVEIAANATRKFYLTLDTTDAAVNNKLSVGMSGSHTVTGRTFYGLVWYDGKSSDTVSNTYFIAAHDGTLPLITKTLSY